jgi:uncharacterized protein YaaR (DUF327 family)
MRVENRFVSTKEQLKKGKKPVNAEASFLDTLKDIENEAAPELSFEEGENADLKNLAGLIEQIGESLSTNPDPENFNRYKKHIQLFISLIQKNLEVKDTVSRISFSKQKLYKTVETIDEDMAELARLILSGEKDRLSYLKLANHIRGLIIDLVM